MGTTLHAIVEQIDPSTKRWYAVAEWYFEKDYALMVRLDRCRHDTDWPSDVSFHSRYMIDRDTSHCRHTFNSFDLPAPTEDSSDRYRAMINSLSVLRFSLVRVLFYRM